MRLDSLAEGTRFKYPECERVGTVVMHGLSGSRVKFEGDERKVEIGDASFTAPGRPVLVSSGSEVLLWPKGSIAERVGSTAPRKPATVAGLKVQWAVLSPSSAKVSSAGGSETRRRNRYSAPSKPKRRTKR